MLDLFQVSEKLLQLVWKVKEEEKVEEVPTHEGKIGNSRLLLV